MDRPLIDRWTDSTAFRIALIFSSVLVLPVLALGLVVSFVMVAVALIERTAEFSGAVVVALSVGGAVGMLGWLRARSASAPARDPTATLACLAIGAATALAVAAVVTVPTLGTALAPWGDWDAVLWASPFIVANVVWAGSGIGSMQRLVRLHAERTRRAFDGMPLVMLLVAIALAGTATLVATAI